MYLSFYGLEEQPFNITPDSRFLFLSQRHKEALASLLYGIEQRKGFILITGEIGSGKTTLCRALLKELDSEQTKIALIFNPLLSEVELLRAINQEFGLEAQLNSKKDLMDELNEFLLAETLKGHNVVVVIDEAQNLTPPLLEQLRLLSNLETETEKLLQIVLIGQPELQAMLKLPQLQQLNQRIAVRYHLESLSQDEVSQYIKHRLNVAGAKIDIKFTPKALTLIYDFTQGVPRKINILCDRALLIGYVAGSYEIDEEIMEKAVEEVSGKPRLPLPGSKTLGIITQPAKKSKRAKKRITAELILTSLLAVMLVGVIVIGAIYWMQRQMQRSLLEYITPGSSDLTDKVLEAKEFSIATEKTTPATSPPSLIAEERKALAPTPEIKPVEKRTYQYNWEYDEQGIIRVSSPYFSFQASVLNWLCLWGRKPDPSGLRHRSKEEIMSLNIRDSGSRLHLKKVEISLPFMDLVSLDLPVILNLNAAECPLSPWVVLKRVEGYSITAIDPVKGLVVTTREKLKPAYLGAIGLYFDKDNLSTITADEESERVAKLQDFLVQAGFLQGKPSGKFDKSTLSAIEKLQKNYNQPPSGELDPLTVMIITSRQHPNRPRLFSTED